MSLETTSALTTHLRAVAQWLAEDVPSPVECLGTTLEVRPAPDGVVARCSTTGADGGRTVPWLLPPDHGIAAHVVALQRLMARPGEGTWVMAAIDVDALGTATLRVTDDAPAELVPGRWITTDELRAHLREFPRDEPREWMLDLLSAPEDVRPV